MSRHEIPAKHPAHIAFVGWDHPLQTFFAQVYSGDTDPDSMVLWVGADRQRQLYEIEDLVKASAKFINISPEMRATLYGDKDEGR